MSGARRAGFLLYTGRYRGESPRDAAGNLEAFAVAGERCGWDEVWVTEHQFNPRLIGASALAAVAFLAGRTDRIGLGTGVTVLPNHHPLAIAGQANMVDHLSGGRLRLGVGRGLPLLDNEVLGHGLAAREVGFDEALGVLVDGLTGKRFDAAGTEFAFPPLAVCPPPAGDRQVPVAVAATSRATAAVAARHGLPLLLSYHFPIEARLDLLDCYAEVAAGHGHDLDAVEHVDSALVQVGDDRDDARRVVLDGYVPWFVDVLAESTPPPGQRPPPMSPADMEASLAHQAIGSAVQCVDALAANLARTGCRNLLIFVEGACRRDLVIDNIERIGADVLPHLH